MAKKPVTWDGTCTQAEFAVQMGHGDGWVTQLKDAGRLLMTADGSRVVAIPSVRLILDTEDPSRDTEGGSSNAQRRAKALADKAEYEAEDSRLDLAVRAGDLWHKTDIRHALNQHMQTLRNGLESLPAIRAPELAALDDEGRVRVVLTDALEVLLEETARQFALVSAGGAA